MNNKLTLALALVGGLFFGGQAMAQTCANPIVLHSNFAVTGDTCTAANTLPSYGGTTSAQNEVIYSFVAGTTGGGNPATYATLTLGQTGGFAGSAAGVFLLPTCTAATDPTAFGVSGTPLDLNSASLVSGQTYYVAVTADPTSPAASCGQYSLSATGSGFLPVSLQKFSVE